MKKVALVIGANHYPTNALVSPIHDAEDMAVLLREFGFSVIPLVDPKRSEIKEAIYKFEDKLERDSIAFFYFSGHGLQYQGTNYLVPIDAHIRKEYAIEDEAIKVDLILNAMNSARSSSNLLILDACRDNPFLKNFKSLQKGLAASKTAPMGTLIFYATSPGRVAMDGGNKRNSVFTEALLQEMKVSGKNFDNIIRSVTVEVEKSSGGEQTPWIEGFTKSEFYFLPPKNNNSKQDDRIDLTKYEKTILKYIYLQIHAEGNIKGVAGFKYSELADFLNERHEFGINSSQVHHILINLKDKGFIKANFSFEYALKIELLRDVKGYIDLSVESEIKDKGAENQKIEVMEKKEIETALIFVIDLNNSTKYKQIHPSAESWNLLDDQIEEIDAWIKSLPISYSYINFTGDGFVVLFEEYEKLIPIMENNTSENSLDKLVDNLASRRKKIPALEFKKPELQDENYFTLCAPRISIHISENPFRRVLNHIIGPDIDFAVRLNKPEIQSAQKHSHFKDYFIYPMDKNFVVHSPIFLSESASRLFEGKKLLGEMQAKGIIYENHKVYLHEDSGIFRA